VRNYILCFTLACIGCGNNPFFDDDEGSPEPSASALSEHPDHLSLPYVSGGKVGISTTHAAADWQMKSDNAAVFTVDKQTFDGSGKLSADCTAVAPGSATLTLVDGKGSEQRRATIQVQTPDSAKIIAHGPARLQGGSAPDLSSAEVTEAMVYTGSGVNGGTSVFAVAYFNGPTRLFGRGVAKVTPPAGIAVDAHTTSGLLVTEFLFVKPSLPGSYPLAISAGGPTLATLTVTAVGDSAIAQLTLDPEVGDSPNDGDQVWVLAQTRDAMGHPIFGAYSTWTLDGVAQLQGDMKTTSGDLFRFKFDASGATTRELAATAGATSAKVAIHAHSGQVFDTTYLGCSLAPSRRATAAPVLALFAGLVVLGLRRRR
jgi:hypothetical protein